MKRTYDNKENFSLASNKVGEGRRTKPKQTSAMFSCLLEQLECPICMHAYCDKVYVCANGHSVCGSCYPKINQKCPSCRTALTGARNQALENIVRSTVLPCRYAEYGCDFKGKGEARAAHKAKCIFQPVKCLFHR